MSQLNAIVSRIVQILVADDVQAIFQRQYFLLGVAMDDQPLSPSHTTKLSGS